MTTLERAEVYQPNDPICGPWMWNVRIRKGRLLYGAHGPSESRDAAELQVLEVCEKAGLRGEAEKMLAASSAA